MRTSLAIFMMLMLGITSAFSQQREYQVKIEAPKKVKVPEKNLKGGEGKVTEEIKKIIDKEVSFHLAEFKKNYDDFPANPESKVNLATYKTDDGLTVIHQTVFLEYEYAEISVFVIIDKDKTYTYSRSDVLSEFISLIALKKKGNSYQLYGNLKGNPKSTYSGDFVWTFEGKNRVLSFSNKK